MRYFLFLAFFAPLTIFANSHQTIVLVSGVTSENSWIKTGIATQLNKSHKVFIPNIPFNLPIQTQSKLLNSYIKDIKGDIILVGHSAGGVVARNVVVNGSNDNITHLITIASPHLGSSIASTSTLLNSIPFSSFISKPLFSDSYYAQAPIQQLMPNSRIITQLNKQEHPNICYSSVIKTGGMINNSFADIASQNMNLIQSIDSDRFFSKNGHALTPDDYFYIINSIKSCFVSRQVPISVTF